MDVSSCKYCASSISLRCRPQPFVLEGCASRRRPSRERCRGPRGRGRPPSRPSRTRVSWRGEGGSPIRHAFAPGSGPRFASCPRNVSGRRCPVRIVMGQRGLVLSAAFALMACSSMDSGDSPIDVSGLQVGRLVFRARPSGRRSKPTAAHSRSRLRTRRPDHNRRPTSRSRSGRPDSVIRAPLAATTRGTRRDRAGSLSRSAHRH